MRPAGRILTLDEATPDTSGGKASTLATLRRAGVDVPDGFVLPISEYRRHHDRAADASHSHPRRLETGLLAALEAHLALLAGRHGAGAEDGASEYVAVRSSASDEDGPRSSLAGQHDTVLAVRGTQAVAAAVAQCWASLHSRRATAYREGRRTANGPPPGMAVLVQRLVDADASGVLFTQTPRVIEAVRGLGAPLVSGEVTPDAWTLDDTGIIARRAGRAVRRLDRHGERLVTTTVGGQTQMCLPDADVLQLDRLGQEISRVLRYDADIEWAHTTHRFHILQARPITAALAQRFSQGPGIAASPGQATGPTRVLRGPQDFHQFRRGDIVVCRTTDPAWTPLFTLAAGVVTETGGLLSHAAIVAREVGIPAILSVPQATTRFPDGTDITIDGTTGHIRSAETG